MSSADTEASTRVLVAAIRLSAKQAVVDIAEIANGARTSSSFAQRVLARTGCLSGEERISLGSKQRLLLALEVARNGMLENAARALTWQEFEIFAEECLGEAGFQTEKNVRVKGDGRAWQIDVVGVRGGLILSVDCKHWNTPGYLSKFKLAAEHQRTATLHLLARQAKTTVHGGEKRQALPIILTMSEPPAQLYGGVVLVSVEKLPNFLSGVAPYDENLPFISLPSVVVENPMSLSS
ncbi:MAG TPA: hypothetical protein VNW25_06810 [Candidatus Sulfotelmatobacter sp.]|jgi:hypothetical protein|nr:hypothetical protein [Candidatus Sulfotelmatobacter sp.]